MTDGSELAWVDLIWVAVKLGLIIIFASGFVWQLRHHHK